MELLIVRKLINRLNDEDVLYCHWKSNQHVKDVFTGVDDIDMLISTKDTLKLNIILNELGYKRFYVPTPRAYIGIEDYLGFDEKTGKIVHLHLHYQLTMGEKHLKGYQVPWEEDVLRNRVFDKKYSIYISNHMDELMLLLVRGAIKLRHRDFVKRIFKKDVIGKSTHQEYNWLVNQIDKNCFEEYLYRYLSDKSIQQIMKILDSEIKLSNLYRLKKYVEKDLKIFKLSGVLKATIFRWLREVYRVCHIINNKLFKQPIVFRRRSINGGKIIAFIGPDGAGKSTLIREVKKSLKPYMDIHEEYLGSGDGQSSLIRKPIKVFYNICLKVGIISRKSKKISDNGVVNYAGESKKVNKLRAIGIIPWTILLSLERKNKLKRARKFRNKGFLVITDRYLQNEFADICDGPRFQNNDLNNYFSNKVTNIERKTFDMAKKSLPDAVIKLQVPSEVAYERKPDEIDIDTHKKLMDTILQLKFSESTVEYIIDSSGEVEDTKREVMKKVWECL